MKLIADAGVDVPYFIPERFSEAARRWFRSAQRLSAPDFLMLEIGNVLWKKRRRGEITDAEAERILARRWTVGSLCTRRAV